MNYPIYAKCDHCDAATDLVCGDGAGHHFCSGTCCAAYQAPLERSHKRDQDLADQRADDEFLLAQGFYADHAQQEEEGLI